MNVQFDQLVSLLIRELISHKAKVVLVFCIISTCFLMIGLVWPKQYVSFTTVVSDNQNIIQPLLAGTAVSTKNVDQIRLAKEILFSQKLMHQLLLKTNLITENTNPLQEELISLRIKKSTKVKKLGKTLIKITHRGSDPVKVFNITKAFVDFFIKETVKSKIRESKEAYIFIEKQLAEYHNKLIDAEEKLKNLRSKNYDARPGTEMAVNEAIAGYRKNINLSRLELREAVIKRRSIESQLSGEAEISTTTTRDEQFRTRISQLQNQLDTLLLSYHEEHPDIVRIKRQIDDIKKTIIKQSELDKEARIIAKESGEIYIDEGVLLSPLYQQLRSTLSLTKTKILTLKARIAETKNLMKEEFERLERIGETEATLAELTRDYEVNRDMYTSLQTRREKANISMNLGTERNVPSFKIQEPARVALVPSGLRFLHFMIAGILIGVLIPIGATYGFIFFSHKVRIPIFIEEKLNIPILAIIPHICDDLEIQADKILNRNLIFMVAAVGILYITFGTLKISQVL